MHHIQIVYLMQKVNNMVGILFKIDTFCMIFQSIWSQNMLHLFYVDFY